MSFKPLLASLLLTAAVSAMAANPPASPEAANATGSRTGYVPLGSTPFGPNGHGSYTWFVDAERGDVVMCLVHNPQTPIECKRAPMPAVLPPPAGPK